MRLRTMLIVAVVGIVVLAGGVVLLVTRFGEHLPPGLRGEGCEVNTAAGEVNLTTEQVANAATITAVGLRRKVPYEGLIVALAVALQESKLKNLPHGDRDSIGLFQQRPSQGWGTEQELQDPRTAAAKFYHALVRVKGWQDMRVTEAAQRVQRSAYPEAYEQWVNKASVLAAAFAGRVPNAVACTLLGSPSRRGEAAAQSLGQGLRLDWGTVSTSATTGSVGLVVSAADDQGGWQFAHWIVAHSSANGVERVRFGQQEWSAESGAWRSVGTSEADVNAGGSGAHVVAQVYAS